MANQDNTTEKKGNTYSNQDVGDYRPIIVASSFLSETGRVSEGNKPALEKILTDFVVGTGVKKPRDVEAQVKLTMTSPGGLANFINEFGTFYQEALNSRKLSDLRQVYDASFRAYFSEEDLARADAIFASDQTYGDFMGEYGKVAERAKNEVGNFTEEQEKEAKEKLKELKKIVSPLQDFEKLEIEKLRSSADAHSLREKYKKLYKEEEPQEAEA